MKKMSPAELLVFIYDISEERATQLVAVNPGLTVDEIADKEGLEVIEHISDEDYGADKCD